MEQIGQYDAYEPPMLVEVGDFAELTRGSSGDSFDAFAYFSSFFFCW